jgi:hypothetical protein
MPICVSYCCNMPSARSTSRKFKPVAIDGDLDLARLRCPPRSG